MIDIYFLAVVKFHYVIDVVAECDKHENFWQQTQIYFQFSIHKLSSVFFLLQRNILNSMI